MVVTETARVLGLVAQLRPVVLMDVGVWEGGWESRWGSVQ